MLIPTKSGGQIFVNLRKNKEKKNIFFSPFEKSFPTPLPFLLIPFVWLLLLFFLMWDPHVPLFHFLVRFSPETIYFVLVSVPSILNGKSLTICYFSGFSLKILFCGVHLMHIASNFVKIQLSQNSTKFDWVT